MAVVGIGKSQAIDEAFVAGNKAVRDCIVHQGAGPLQLRLGKIPTLAYDATDPLVVNPIRPTGSKEVGKGKAKKKGTDGRG